MPQVASDVGRGTGMQNSKSQNGLKLVHVLIRESVLNGLQRDFRHFDIQSLLQLIFPQKHTMSVKLINYV